LPDVSKAESVFNLPVSEYLDRHIHRHSQRFHPNKYTLIGLDRVESFRLEDPDHQQILAYTLVSFGLSHAAFSWACFNILIVARISLRGTKYRVDGKVFLCQNRRIPELASTQRFRVCLMV
jgi:hypothetical protein